MNISFAQHLPARLTQVLLDLLQSDYQLDADVLSRIQELCSPDTDDPEGFMSLENFALARDIAIKACGDPALGFKFGQQLEVLRLGPLGVAASSSHRVDEMFELIGRFADALFPAHFESQVKGELFELNCTFPPLLDRNREFYAQVLVSGTLSFLENLVGYLPQDITIHFPLEDAEFYRDQLPYRLQFNSTSLCLAFPKSYASAPLLTSDPAAHELYVKACESVTQKLQSSRSLGASIRHLLEGYEQHYPSLEQVADMLRIPSRTLRDRLAKENVSFRQLLTECRTDKAKKLLDESSLTVAVIAEQLGYGDTANFCRAFKREAGLSPSAYRNL
jgi:AraC-like DNA-binding protein